jgi:hypothetical protein
LSEIPNSRIGHERQLVFLNTDRLIGVQSLDITNNFSMSPVSYAGIGSQPIKNIPNGEQSANINLSTFLINKDYFWSYTTGAGLVNMYVTKDKDLSTCYSLISGYFTSFSCNYSIGNVPEISTTMVALKNAGTIPTGELPLEPFNQLNTIRYSNSDITGTLLIPFGNSISLGISDFYTNRVQNFVISAASNKTPVYNMGSKFPARIDHQSTQISFDVSFVVADYVAQKMRLDNLNGATKNLNLVAGDYSNSGNIVATYSLDNLVLLNESYKAQINGDVLISQSYSKKIYPI